MGLSFLDILVAWPEELAKYSYQIYARGTSTVGAGAASVPHAINVPIVVSGTKVHPVRLPLRYQGLLLSPLNILKKQSKVNHVFPRRLTPIITGRHHLRRPSRRRCMHPPGQTRRGPPHAPRYYRGGRACPRGCEGWGGGPGGISEV